MELFSSLVGSRSFKGDALKNIFQKISEHGIFHGITDWKEHKSLITRDKNGLLIIEWE
jgi:hypothetical protein